MKKILLVVLISLVTLCSFTLFTGCSEEEKTTATVHYVSGLDLETNTIKDQTVKIGKKAKNLMSSS